MANQIRFNVGFNVDKTGLTELQSILKTITTESQFSSVSEELKQAGAAASTLSDILEKSFNKDLGVMNVNKFNAELSKSNLNIRQAKIELEKAGSTGSRAYNLLTNAILGTNVQLKESNKLLDDMAISMSNTIQWGITSSIFNKISGSIQKAYGYAKNLDSSLNDIRIVTDKSAESMREFAKQANDAAKGLGASTLDYTEASLIYYQQGLSDEEVAARAETTIKAANVTGQTGQEVSEQLTAVWNGYKATAEEAELYVDKLAAVAATTAADLEELSTGMSKVASAANLMGVDIDQLNAQLATIVSVTRQAPESVGTALKTIYARMGDIEAGLDSETTLGAYTEAMSEMGFNVLDMNGNLRDMGEIIEEIGEKWSTMSREQQISLSQTMAGTRQYNNLLALFDNWDMYTDALQTSADAAGTLQKQQDIYMESTEAHLKELKASMEGIYDNIFEPSELNVMIDGLTNLANTAENFTNSFGGGLKSIAGIGIIVANIFNKQISAGLVKAIENQEKYNQNVAILEKKAELLKENQIQSGQSASPMDQAISANTETQLKYAREIQQVRAGISSEEYNILTNMQQQMGQLEQEAVLIEQTALKRAEGLTLKKEENVFEKISLDNAELIATQYEEIANAKQINLELTQENTKAILKELNSVIAIENESEEMNVILSNIISIRDRMSDEVGEQLGNEIDILRQLEDEEDKAKFLLENKEKILKVLKQIEIAEGKNVDRTKQQAKNAQEVANAKERAEGIREQEGQIANEFDDTMETAQRSVDIGQKITTITSSLSTMAMTWMSVNGLMQTWTDENASFGDKLTQTMMTLGMAIPSLISSFEKINTVLGFESTLLDVIKTKLSAYNAQQKLSAVSKQAVLSVSKIEVALMKVRSKELGIHISALSAEEKARIRESALKSKNIVLSEAETAALDKTTASQLALNSAFLANPVVLTIAAIAGAIALLGVSIEAYKKYLANVTKANEENLKQIKKQTEELESQKNAIQEVRTAYADLVTQLEEGNISEEQLRAKTYELCMQHGLQSEAVKALTQDYEELAKTLEDVEKQTNKNLSESYNQEIKSYSKIADAKANQKVAEELGIGDILLASIPGLGAITGAQNDINNAILSGVSGQASFDAGLMSERNDREFLSKFNELLGGDALSDIEITLATGTFDVEKYAEEIARNWDEVETLLGEYSNSDVAQQFKETILDAETFQGMSESVGAKDEFDKQLTSEKYFNENIKNLEDYQEAIDNAVEEIQGRMEDSDIASAIFPSDEEARAWAKSAAAAYGEEFLSYAKANEISEIINADKDEETIKKNNKRLADATDAELDYILLHINTATAAEDIDTFLKDSKKEIEYFNKYSGLVNIKAVVTNEKATSEDFVNFANQSELIETDKLPDNFETMDLESQRIALISYYATESKAIQESKDEYITAENEKLDATEKRLKALEDERTKAQQKYTDVLGNDFNYRSTEGFDAWAEKYNISSDEDFEKMFDSLSTTSVENYSNAQKELHEILSQNSSDYVEYSENMQNYQAEISRANNEIQSIDSQIENLKGFTGYKEVIEGAKIATKGLNQSLDDLQSAYSTLTKAQDEYNEYGQFSLDTVQSLLSLSPEYFSVLSFENNQLTINKEGLRQLYLARIEEAKALAIATSMAKVEAIVAEDSSYKNQTWAEAAGDAATAALKLAEYIDDATLEVINDADVWEDLWNKMTGGIIGNTGLSDDQKKAIAAEEEALRNQLALLDKLGDADFDFAMRGGSGSSKKDKKELKNLEDEIDRYWELNKAIEMVTEALSDLDKQQENLYGRELIESLRQENELLEEQAAAYEALAEEQRKEAYELQGMLQAYGVVFDAQGGIANYLAASQTALDSYNQAVIQYNAGIIDEATFAAAERAYETFKALMERYEALYYEEWQETQNQLDDIHRQQLENNLKAWETELELKLDTAEAERDWNDFLEEINEDFKSHYRDISAEIETLLKNAGTYVADDGTIEADIQAMRDIMAEIDKMKNGGESDMFSSISEAQEKLKELIEQMQDDATALYDLYKSVWEAFMEGIDQSAEKFEDLMEQFERIDGELEYQGQLIELLYGEEAYGMLDKLYKAQEKNTLAQVDSLKQQKDMWYELWQNAEEGSEEQAKYYELWTQAQDDLNSKVIEYIELLQTDYLNTVDDILSKLDKDLTGGMGMEKLKEQWEDAKEEAEKYLNETEEIYAIQSLYNKYSESISNASSLKSQQKLQALREEELQMLREKDKLTQYDIDRAEAKYQIALKEMALEDARNAKDSMKLTRGTDGNWSYQYVADEDEIANKEQELLDAQNNLYEIDMEEQMNKIDEYIEKLSEFQEEKEELYRQLYATTDEIEKQRILDDIARLEEEYYPQLEELATGFEEVNQNLAASSAGVMLTALTQNKENFASLTEEQRLLMEDLIASGIEDYADLESKVKLNYDGIGLKAEEALSSISASWNTGAQALIDAWNADDGESVKAQMEEAHKAIMEAADEYQRKIEEVAEIVEEDWSEDGITGAIGEAEEATEDLEDATEDLVDETVDLLDEYADALEEVEEMWEEVKDAIEEATAAAREYMSLTGSGGSSGNGGPGYNPTNPPTKTPSPGGSGNGDNPGGTKNYTYTVGFVNGDETWHKYHLDWNGVEFEKQANEPYDKDDSYIKNEVTGKVKDIKTTKAFDTGGYTGDWAGGEGKMAMLHSKELVLNAADTKNILKVVDTVRDLSNLSSSIEEVIMRNIGSMLAKMMNLGNTNTNYTTNTTNNEQKTENVFHINAEFPNANDVSEIREAILSLPNIASQYLMENKK